VKSIIVCYLGHNRYTVKSHYLVFITLRPHKKFDRHITSKSPLSCYASPPQLTFLYSLSVIMPLKSSLGWLGTE